MTAIESADGARLSEAQDEPPSGAHGQHRAPQPLPTHTLNNVLARIIAMAEDLTDHPDVQVARIGEALIAEAERAARLTRERA